MLTLPLRLPTCEPVWVMLVLSVSVESCFLPIIKPMPPVPIRPDFLTSLKLLVVLLLLAARMLTSLPALIWVKLSETTFEPQISVLCPVINTTCLPVRSLLCDVSELRLLQVPNSSNDKSHSNLLLWLSGV